MTEIARIVASYGRAYILELANGERRTASARGKKTDYACGDRVKITVINHEQAVIEAVEPRKTLLYRSDQWRQKLIAANITQLVIVVATEPSFSDELISRAIIAAEAGDIKPVICLNKSELPGADKARARLQYFLSLGYPLIEVSALQDVTPLRTALEGETSVLVGQSGMGKSTLTNALIPEANARVKEISVALDSGKHTTTNATLYKLDERSELIDSPGLQSFGLAHVKAEDLPYLMPEFRVLIGECRFANCRHRQEPDCAMTSAVKAGKIPNERLNLLHRLQDELAQLSTY
ncbi:Small ribosomal subunit biogenesis GTPase RsgA [Andreprevotia sp. IGB-42]|uniref:ribosome small subunit-dependent GTPase A n=1 Tax=Andreprevotia sp. IGB-42 TaxID=2497473 RepID=UPI00135C21FF|nr:ribosome small subunit-dependent GTPase A [Andreprevotia sp. IGB-42]KAF0811694.1 Small ribosomal subunit biogenesis GTPase RsgA [Andreprevotia sp. IGB-42]